MKPYIFEYEDISCRTSFKFTVKPAQLGTKKDSKYTKTRDKGPYWVFPPSNFFFGEWTVTHENNRYLKIKPKLLYNNGEVIGFRILDAENNYDICEVFESKSSSTYSIHSHQRTHSESANSPLSAETAPGTQQATSPNDNPFLEHESDWMKEDKRKQAEQDVEAKRKQAERERQRDEIDAKTDQLINKMGQTVSHLRSRIQEINNGFIHLDQVVKDSASQRLFALQQKLEEAKRRVDRM